VSEEEDDDFFSLSVKSPVSVSPPRHDQSEQEWQYNRLRSALPRTDFLKDDDDSIPKLRTSPVVTPLPFYLSEPQINGFDLP